MSYQLHKWKASTPIHPRKMRRGCIFQQPVQPFLFLFCQHYNQALSVWIFMIGQMLIAHSSTSRCNCLRKSCHLLSLAWMGTEQTMRSGLWLILASVYQSGRKQLHSCSSRVSKRMRKRWCQWRTMVKRPRNVSLGASVSIPPFWKSSKLLGLPVLSHLTLQVANVFKQEYSICSHSHACGICVFP